MPDYITVPIIVDPEQLALVAYQTFQAAFPQWQPDAGAPETVLIEANAPQAAVAATLASGAPDSIFRFYGSLVGILPIDASSATVQSTWTMIDTAGYSIPAGAQVGIRTAGDQLVPFTVLTSVTVAPGSSSTASGAVTLVAVTPGAAGSGLGSIGGPLELIDVLDYVSGITQTAISTGGVDAEDDTTYMSRLRTELQLLTPRPIIPSDFAALALNTAGVARALALDGYNPADGTSGNERMVAVAVQDATGAAASSAVKASLDATLQAQREVNFVVNVIDPTFTVVDVAYTAIAAAGYSTSDVQTRATAAAAAFLSPATWGMPLTGDTRGWTETTTVRLFDLAAAIKNTEGVEHLTALTIGPSGGPLVASDFTLTGPAALPTVGTVTGTVTS